MFKQLTNVVKKSPLRLTSLFGKEIADAVMLKMLANIADVAVSFAHGNLFSYARISGRFGSRFSYGFKAFIEEKYPTAKRKWMAVEDDDFHKFDITKSVTVDGWLYFKYDNAKFLLNCVTDLKDARRSVTNIYSLSGDSKIPVKLFHEYGQWLRGKFSKVYHTPTTTKDVSWWGSEDYTYASLDEIPIHSKARVQIEQIVAATKEKWDANGSYTTGVLLAGIPGSGKTSIARGIAQALTAPVYEYKPVATKSEFRSLMTTARDYAVILFDDADTMPEFAKREEVAKASNAPSVGDMLSYLSRPTKNGSRVNIVTTNYLDKLSSAATRIGRFDRKIMIDFVDDAGIKYWLQKNYEYITIPEDVSFPPRLATDLFFVMNNVADPDDILKAILSGIVIIGETVYHLREEDAPPRELSAD